MKRVTRESLDNSLPFLWGFFHSPRGEAKVGCQSGPDERTRQSPSLWEGQLCRGRMRIFETVPVMQPRTGGHIGPPLQRIWKVIPFNRHRKSSKRGPPREAAPTAFIGGNSKPATRAAKRGRPYGIG